MLYPLLFTSVQKKMIWGSESWDITCRPNEMGVVENGPDAGKTLAEVIERDKQGLLGTRLANVKRFPLLVKIIDARDNLSIQVHPNDAYAAAHHAGESGKCEMWCIIQPPDEGFIYLGLTDGTTRDSFLHAYETGALEACFNRLFVRKGDMVNIPAGMVHALTAGAVIAEVQQNADMTYRLYDYNRLGFDGKPRELHVKDSLATADFNGRFPRCAVSGLTIKKGENQLTYAIVNRYFAVIKYELQESLPETANPAAFSIITCVEGNATIVTPHMTVALPARRSVFIPAELGAYELRGAGVLLKSFVPDREADFFTPLRRYGYTDEEMRGKIALH